MTAYNFVKTDKYLGVTYHIGVYDTGTHDMLSPNSWYSIVIGDNPAIEENGYLSNMQGQVSNQSILQSLDIFEQEAKRRIEESLNLTAELNTPLRQELVARGFMPSLVP